MEQFDLEHPPSLGTCPGLGQAFIKAHQNFSGGGNILEFGVGGGYSYSWMAWWITQVYKTSTLTGFDGWQGLPAETEGLWYPDCHRKGNYVHRPEYVRDKARALGIELDSDPRFQFIDGMYDETLTPELQSFWITRCQEGCPVILINMDVDLHSSAETVLNWILPLLSPGTIIYTDDWYFPAWGHDEPNCGVSLAFHQWWARNPGLKVQTLFECETSQRYFEVLEIPHETV